MSYSSWWGNNYIPFNEDQIKIDNYDDDLDELLIESIFVSGSSGTFIWPKLPTIRWDDEI